MKKYILLIFLVLSSYVETKPLSIQDSTRLNLSRNGFNVVNINLENKSKSEIYSKIIQWIGNTYMSPEQVILAKTDNEIRLKSIVKNICEVKVAQKHTYHVLYTLRIGIQDGAVSCYFDIYQFDYDFLGAYAGKAAVYVKTLFKKSGEPRKVYKNCSDQIPIYFESLLDSLIETINSGLTREEAIKQLKEQKDLFDLGLISEEEYNKLKDKLTPIIMGK